MFTSLTIIVPMLDEEHNIGRTIDSIKNQSNQNFVVVFCDSGSTDNTIKKVTKEMRPSDTIVTFEANLGIAQNWLRSLSYVATHLPSSHIMFLGADDALGDSFVETALKQLDRIGNNVVLAPQFFDAESKKKIVSFENFSRQRLLENWSYAHICYGIFHFESWKETLTKVLMSSGPEFDGLWALAASSQGRVVPISASYLKRKKSGDYSTQYYLGTNADASAKSRLEAALWHHFGQPFNLRKTSKVVFSELPIEPLSFWEAVVIVLSRIRVRLRQQRNHRLIRKPCPVGK